MSQNLELLKILKAKGPLRSSEIKADFLSKGVSEMAARQRISRVASPIQKFTSFNLPNNETFLYLAEQYGTEQFWSHLIDAHKVSNSAYGVAITSLKCRGGIIEENRFPFISGSPEYLSKHLSFKRVLEDLVNSKLIKRYVSQKGGNLIHLDAQGYFSHDKEHELFAYNLAENILLGALKEWVKKLGLVSYNSINIRGDHTPPKFGQYYFDLVAPSYIYPMVTKTSNPLKPGFFVADVVLRKLDIFDLEFFIKKTNANRALQNTRPFMAMLIAESYTADAFQKGKKEGILVVTPDNLFGRDIADGLKDLLITLKNAATIATQDPEKIQTIFESLSKIDGVANNLRGALFEHIVGSIVSDLEGRSMDIGEKVTAPDGSSAEIDIKLIKPNQEVKIYECKSRPPYTELHVDEVRAWFSIRVPTIRNALLEEKRFKNLSFSFNYWTTGKFSPDALEYLKKIKSDTKKYEIDWKDGDEVYISAQKANRESIINVLNTHYLKNMWD